MISIIVPCYNAEDTVESTINSLLGQTVKPHEIILVDDGSTDRTFGICDDAAKKDRKITTIHQNNMGLMAAWKRGVIEATGDYVVFCDSDDYISIDFIERVNDIINQHSPDLIVAGIVHEYSNGDVSYSYNRIPKGYYKTKEIKETILPKLFSDGRMQSEAVIRSRCSKVFRKSVLLKILYCLNNGVGFGEDILTVFAVMQVIQDLYCMGKYCPYHYVRRAESMIGCFDRYVFEKINLLYNEMDTIASKLSYTYRDQLLCDRMSITLLYVKKYICKSTDGYRLTRETIRRVRESREFSDCLANCSFSGYGITNRIFAYMYTWRLYFLLYLLGRLYEQLRGRNV